MTCNNLQNSLKIIKNHLEKMTDSPGVYKMLNEKGGVLYVGKAKNLAKRVSSYIHPERLEYRIQIMISQIADIETIVTSTETEALLLESNLIKKFEPKYNILLKDDKSYPYILIPSDQSYPRIIKHRGKRKIKGKYYGPFVSAGAVNKAISDLQKAFLIRPCTDNYLANRQRPCLEYQIKRCSAPCVNKISEEDYAELVCQAKDFLSGGSRKIQKQLITLMEEESLRHNYEKAAVYRDRIKALNQIQAKQSINIASLKDTDVIGLYIKDNKCCIQIIFFRNGQNLGGKAFFPKNTEEQSAECIIDAFVCQFYGAGHIPPKEIIICNFPADPMLLEESLSKIAEHKVKITIPKLGNKKKLVQDAIRNAQNSLKQKISGNLKHKQQLAGIMDIFNLPSTPRRIEVYDNSHISGTNAVGAMIVAGEDGFNKKGYRCFNIKDKSINPGDDYAMMTEVLMRRFKRLKQESPDKQGGVWPDLVLIDGGAGHLSVVQKVFKKLGLTEKIVFVCISKGPDRNAGREQFHMTGKKPFTLPQDDPLMYYLQTLRDEAHRFAIGTHRKKRSKSMIKSV